MKGEEGEERLPFVSTSTSRNFCGKRCSWRDIYKKMKKMTLKNQSKQKIYKVNMPWNQYLYKSTNPFSSHFILNFDLITNKLNRLQIISLSIPI